MKAFVTCAAVAPATSQDHLRYALLRGTYPNTEWWTGSAWRATGTKPGRIAWYKTRERAEKILAKVVS